jgi:aryl-alcohol dehydrogenase-like predicted oxidoreductase
VTPVAQTALGRSGLRVARIGLGCMGMTNAYGPADRGEALATLHHALDLGVDMLDTADVYGGGANEELVGEAVRGRRAQACVATKFGILRTGGALSGVSGRPEYVRSACERSLRRLGVDAIDLYTLHRVDPEVPIEETVGAMAGLVAQGKVRHLGLSEAGPESLRRACATHPIAALQSEYSLWTRDPERGALAACRELGVGFVAYSPLGRGFLAGRVESESSLVEGDNRRRHPRFRGANLEHNLALLDALRGVAAELRCTPAQLALRWVLDRGDDVVPIPGTSRRRHLDEMVEALALVLSPAQRAALDAAFPPGAAHGDRYPAEVMTTVGR